MSSNLSRICSFPLLQISVSIEPGSTTVTSISQGRSSSVESPSDEWRTALTYIEANKILVRGYPLDEIMGRLTFGETIYLLLVGEVPTPGMGRLMEARRRARRRELHAVSR